MTTAKMLLSAAPFRGTTVIVMLSVDEFGRTHATDLLSGIASFAYKEVGVFAVGDGADGLRHRIGAAWFTDIPYDTPECQAQKWLQDHAHDADVIFLNVGTDVTELGLPVSGFIGRILLLLREGGANIITFIVTSPNLPFDNAILEHRNTYGLLGKLYVIRYDRDGTGKFPHCPEDSQSASVDLPHVPPGLLAVRLGQVGCLGGLLLNPQPAYFKATALWARLTLEVASQPLVASLFGTVDTEMLSELARGTPINLRYDIPTRARASDMMLGLNEAMYEAHRRMLMRGPEMDIRSAQPDHHLDQAFLYILDNVSPSANSFI